MTLEEKKRICVEVAKEKLKEDIPEEDKKQLIEYLKMWGEKI